MDVNWSRLPVVYARPPIGHPLPRPPHLDQMLEYARILSAAFSFARIDFYISEQKLYFSEITFHQYAGLMPFEPCSFDYELGAMLSI